MKKLIALLMIGLMLGGLAACQQAGSDAKTSASKTSPFMTHFNLENVATGEEETAALFKGHEQNLVLFWQGDNEASRQNIQVLKAYQKAHPEVQVLLVAVEMEKEAARKVVAPLDLPFPCVLGEKDYYELVNYAIPELPTLFVLNEKGKSTQAPISGKMASREALEKQLTQK